MVQPQFVAVIRVPVFADTEDEARSCIDPYVRDMRVEATVEIEHNPDFVPRPAHDISHVMSDERAIPDLQDCGA